MKRGKRRAGLLGREKGEESVFGGGSPSQKKVTESEGKGGPDTKRDLSTLRCSMASPENFTKKASKSSTRFWLRVIDSIDVTAQKTETVRGKKASHRERRLLFLSPNAPRTIERAGHAKGVWGPLSSSKGRNYKHLPTHVFDIMEGRGTTGNCASETQVQKGSIC